jgi:hypothetical protein
MDFIKKAVDLLGSYKQKIFPTLDVKPVYEGDKSKTIPGIANDQFEGNGVSQTPKYASIIVGGLVLIAAYKIFWKK